MNFNKKLKGKWSREDPELSAAISLLILIRNNKENEAGEDPEVSGAISWLDLIRNWKEIVESNKKATKP